MTKKELERLRALKNEIRLLRKEINNLPMTKDSVTGSMTEHPYIKATIPIAGLDMTLNASLQLRLEGKVAELQKMVAEMEDWLDGVPDSEMRTILRLYYRNGMTQRQIGEELGYDRSIISKKINIFFKEE